MLIGLDETDLAVEVPRVLRVLRPGLGLDLDKAISGHHTAMTGHHTTMTDCVLAITSLVPVTRRSCSIIVTGLITGVDILAHAPIFIVETNKDFQRSLEGY